MSIFSERLKFLRKQKGESQEVAATAIGISRNCLSKYETAQREPDLETLVLIAQHYDSNPNYLLGYPDVWDTPTGFHEILDRYQVTKICEKALGLSVEGKNALADYIDLLVTRDKYQETRKRLEELEGLRRNYQQYKDQKKQNPTDS